MTAREPQPARAPTSVRAVGIVLGVAGALYLIAGVTGLSSTERADALMAMGVVALGALYLGFGWKLVQGARWAYIGTVIVLGLTVVAGIIAAITTSDRAILAQLFVPGLGLYLLSRRESRDHFLV